jgi:SAM-dependent methyltransferase
MVAILSDKKTFIFQAVRDMYTEVATQPGKGFHFPTGRLACLFVGYPAALLDRIPAAATASFAGVGYPFAAGVIQPGDTVLDIGSGAGTDTLIASLLVGEQGTAVGLDMTPAMRARLQANGRTLGAGNLRVIGGNAEEIPLPDASVDVVTSNGVLNLVPDKPRAFAEIVRVLKPGGRVQIADIALGKPVSDSAKLDPKLWAECIVGAVLEAQYVAGLQEAGLDVDVISRLDYFAGSDTESTRRVAHGLGAHSLVLRGKKA